jgi:hypothetical protein
VFVLSWADQYLIARANLYGDDDSEGLAHSFDAKGEVENREDNSIDADFQANKNRFINEAVNDPNGCWNRTFTLLDYRRSSVA